MTCERCGAAQNDAEASFCSRCGAPLAPAEREEPADSTMELAEPAPTTAELSHTTGSLRVDEDGSSRGPLDEDDGPASISPNAPTAEVTDRPLPRPNPLRELGSASASYLVHGGWLQASSAAGVAFLALLCVGALGVLAVKLQDPSFGTGAGPGGVLTALVLAALGSLGTGMHIDDLTLFAFPLGGLLMSGAVIALIASLSARASQAPTRRVRAIQGAKIGVPLAIICAVAAAIFRFRGQVPVYAGVVESFVAALLWGVLFGALGGLKGTGKLRRLWPEARARLEGTSASVRAAISASATMLGTIFIMAIAAALLWLVLALATGGPPSGFDAGDAGAAIVFLVAFAPNVLGAIIAASMGASIAIGARVSLQGELVGPLREISMFDWAGRETPEFIYALLLLPIIATVFGGFVLHRNHPQRSPFGPLALAATAFAVVLGAVALLGEARLGGGLVSARGFGRVAPDAIQTFVFAWLWAFVGGFLGWTIGTQGSSHTRHAAVTGPDEPAPAGERDVPAARVPGPDDVHPDAERRFESARVPPPGGAAGTHAPEPIAENQRGARYEAARIPPPDDDDDEEPRP